MELAGQCWLQRRYKQRRHAPSAANKILQITSFVLIVESDWTVIAPIVVKLFQLIPDTARIVLISVVMDGVVRHSEDHVVLRAGNLLAWLFMVLDLNLGVALFRIRMGRIWK